MKYLKRLLLFWILCILLIFSSVSVFAEGDFDSALSTFLGHKASEEDKYNWSLVITSLQTDGFSNEAIAGIMGNAFAEGAAGGEYAIEGYSGIASDQGVAYNNFKSGQTYTYTNKPKLYTSKKTGKTMAGEGHGICQWSFGRAIGLSNYAKEHPEFGGVVVTHWIKDYDTDWFTGTYNIPNTAGQVCWMLEEMHGDYSDTKSAIKDLTDAREAAKIFHDKYEGSAGWSEARANSAELAVPVVEACTGLTGSDLIINKSDTYDATAIANQMMQKGYWTEDQLGAYCKLCELNIQEFLDGATRDRLNQKALQSLTKWQRNVDRIKKDYSFTEILRRIAMLLGILLVIWSMLIYLAYWFDRLNTIFDIDALSLLTFGRLHISDDESKCTYQLLGDNAGKKTVNHKAILYICGISVLFSFLLISGYIYKIISAFINLLLRIFKM